ncbi:hypothetical protein Taro_023070, partial [Colocasia esculenta]|nr:hypothetical protein [Colocasia esculenta]
LGSVCTSSSYSSRLGLVYASSSYNSRTKCFRTSSFFDRCIYSARGRGCCQSTGGGGSFYDGTLREVWINGDKIEPAQASQFITRSIQAHFPGPIPRFNDFPMDVQKLLCQMFMSPRPDSLEGGHTDMDEERLLGRSVQHMATERWYSFM